MKRVDYDDRLYRVYAKGRALTDGQRANWAAAFARHLPATRPLHGLDIGSGVGRLTPMFAEICGGPVVGIEPSDRMRAVAVDTATHPAVEYRPGTAGATGLPDASVDAALAFLVWHHVPDRPAAARELARVVRPGGVLLLRTQFADRMPYLWTFARSARAREVDAAMYETLAVVRADFTAAGWASVELHEVEEPAVGTYRDGLERLRSRAFSTFEALTEDEIDEWFAAVAEWVAPRADEPAPAARADLLVLRR